MPHMQAMKLDAYMKLVGLTDEQLASMVDLDRSTVTKLRNGQAVPSFKSLERIHTATEGAVSFGDFRTEAA